MADDTTSKSKEIEDEAKKAMDRLQHLELDLQEVKKHLQNITGRSKEISHTGGSTGASRELSHTGGGGGVG
jgi:uncharacterized membrane protein